MRFHTGRVIIISLVALMSSMSLLFGQSSEFLTFHDEMFVNSSPSPDDGQVENKPLDQLPLIYIHGGGGVALAWLASSDIEDLLIEDAVIGSLGLPLSWNIHAGIRNIVQYEFHKGDGSHNIRQMGFVEGGGYGNTGIGTKAEVEMDYDYEENVIKFNPLFWMTKRTRGWTNYAYFLMAGKGTVEYLDKAGDGFRGDSSILGIEVATISKYMSASFSIKHYTIEFERGEVFDIPFNTKLGASHTQMQISLSFGFGI